MRKLPDSLKNDISKLFGIEVLPTLIGSEGPFCSNSTIFKRSENPEVQKFFRILVFSANLNSSFFSENSPTGIMTIEYSDEERSNHSNVYFMFSRDFRYLVKLLEEVESWAQGMTNRKPMIPERNQLLRISH